MVMLKICIALSTFIAVTFSASQSAYLGVRWFEIKTAKEIQIKSRDKAKTDFEKADKEWEKFKEKYGKTYETLTEEINRFDIFKSNLKFIIHHNTEYNNGTHSYFLGINRMADMDLNEFRKLNGYKRPNNKSTEKKCSTYLSASNVILPDHVDWRKEGYVTPVKDQGNCGSCWAFSTTGSLEGQNYRKTKQLVSLSEQQLIDCSRKFGNKGCDGGWMDNSFEYIQYAGGIVSEEEYPYKHRQGRCHAHRSEYVAEDTGCVDVESESERQLQDAVANVGPVSVAIDASHMSFQLYEGGVYDEPQCSSELLDHGVLAVGYGTSDEGDDYWIVKNSWNKDWGMEGYILMSRNKENQCGIATEASYPLV